MCHNIDGSQAALQKRLWLETAKELKEHDDRPVDLKYKMCDYYNKCSALEQDEMQLFIEENWEELCDI